MSIQTDIKQAMRDGNRTVESIWMAVSEEKTDNDGNVIYEDNGDAKRSPSRSYVNRIMKELLDDKVLVRPEKDGREWQYFITEEYERNNDTDTEWYGTGETQQPGNPPAPGKQAALSDAAAAPQQAPQPGQMPPSMDAPTGLNMPVNRDYDHSEEIQSGVPPYIPNGNELAQILATINTRHESGKLPRFLIGGPTGCGKTLLAKYLSQYLDAPMYTIQGKWALNESHLLGRPIMLGDTSYWVDGPLVKALLASQEGEVVLLLDELNRARPDSKGVLFPALDDRARADLDARGGETIIGNPENLIVIGTVNEGRNYFNEQMDLAEIRRLATKHNVDYLGRSHPDREAKLVAERTPATQNIARMLVETSNLIRIEADKMGSSVELGIPTASVISWAQETYAFEEADMPSPFVEAAKSTIIRPYYDSNPNAQTLVETTITDAYEDLPFDEDGIAKAKGQDVQSLVKEMENEREEAQKQA